MQLTNFYEKVYEQFGKSLGDFYLRDTVLPVLNSRTPLVALELGVEPKKVWLALCEEFSVPQEDW